MISSSVDTTKPCRLFKNSPPSKSKGPEPFLFSSRSSWVNARAQAPLLAFTGCGTETGHLIFLSLRIRLINICENTLNTVMSTTAVIFTKLLSSSPSFCLHASRGKATKGSRGQLYTSLKCSQSNAFISSKSSHLKRVITTH